MSIWVGCHTITRLSLLHVVECAPSSYLAVRLADWVACAKLSVFIFVSFGTTRCWGSDVNRDIVM